ncbi:hypothetical protein [Rhizobium herbae]|uniref:Uncharacterized protein n=1 Tax=Rhizobium herbae TaxID=508661 RepID=A0ABS4ER79_9HYPH|nr:hypothetical protein [Rhizobium herbae]MBP1860449.1 hypothetical protein [Rhizobium herbae]
MLQTLNTIRTHILLCLPDPYVTTMLNAFLTSNGFAVTTTYLLREFTEAAALGRYSVVITSTAVAGRIRDVSALPIIDISAFLVNTAGGIGHRHSKSLDSTALAERIKTVIALNPGRDRLAKSGRLNVKNGCMQRPE